MGRVILSRLAAAFPLLVATSLLAFLLVHWAPGSIVDLLRLRPGIPESVLDELTRRYGFDRPWYQQYLSWLLGLLHGDFGLSFSYQQPVARLLRESVPRTIVLAASAQLLTIPAGLALGLFSVRRLHGRWDRWSSRAALTLLSVHPIVLAVVALGFAARSGLVPIGGGSSFGTGDTALAVLWDYLHHLVLPLAVLVAVMLPDFFLQARGVLAELLPADFLRAGRARGLLERTLVSRHLLPVGLPPLISFAGSSLGRLLNGAFLVEVVTGWPGMGRLALTAVRDRDPFLLLGTLVVAGVLLLLGNLIADLCLAEADPRIRLEAVSS